MNASEMTPARKREPALKVIERFRSRITPGMYLTTVTRLLSRVPEEILTGLESVVLTDNHVRDYRNDTNRPNVQNAPALGYYHLQTPQRQAWVEIFIDRIISSFPTPVLHIQLVRELLIAKPLFHEIAHHRNAAVGGLRPGSGETLADQWALEMSRSYFRRRYWYIRPLSAPLSRFLRFIGAFRKSRLNRGV